MVEEKIFAEVIALPAEERAAFLRTVCAGDEALRTSVKELVAAHEAGSSVLDTHCEECRQLPALLRRQKEQADLQ